MENKIVLREHKLQKKSLKETILQFWAYTQKQINLKKQYCSNYEFLKSAHSCLWNLFNYCAI